MARQTGVLAVRRNPALTRLLASLGVWIAADWALLVALSVVAYRAGGPGAVGLVGAARVLPGAVFAALVSSLADRLPRAVVLAATHAAMAVISLALAAVSASGTSLTALLSVVATGSILSGAFKPCVSALVPQVVDTPEQLVSANAAYGSVEAAATMVGPLLSGVLVATVRPGVTFLVLAGMFAGAAVGSLTIRTAYQPARPRQRSGLRAVLEPLRGFPLMAARPGVRTVFWVVMAQTAMRGLLNVFVVVLAMRLNGSVAGLFAAVGAGGLVGAQIAVRIGGDAVSARRTGLGVLLWGLPILAIGSWPVTAIAWSGLTVLGLGNAIEDAYGYSLLNRLTPDELAGRAWGAFHTIGAVMVAGGSLAAPVLIDAVGLRWTMALSGAALVTVVLLARPGLRRVDAASTVRGETFALLCAVPALAELPLLSVERLARAAVPIEVAAAVVLLAEGEVGDRLYVIEDGRVVVQQDGHEVRRLGPGESFGEIALLRARPRTATVTSLEPMRLVAIDIDAFVGAVTGHRDAYRAADDTVASLLAADDRR